MEFDVSTGPWWATSAARTRIPQYFCESAFPHCPHLSLTIFLSLPGIAYTIVFNICLPRSFIVIARDTARAYTKKSLPPRTTAIRNIATLCRNDQHLQDFLRSKPEIPLASSSNARKSSQKCVFRDSHVSTDLTNAQKKQRQQVADDEIIAVSALLCGQIQWC